MREEFLWVEKYRPNKIEDCILPEALKETFQKIVDGGKLPNMLFTGTAGLGKTTVARALCTSLDLDYIVVNGSEEGNIDTLRGKIKRFASSVSLGGDVKVVILDEADYLNPQSTQPALRGFIEEFSDNCRFILTCNFKNRIIKPLHSRCSTFDFAIPNAEKPKLAQKFFLRLKEIIKAEELDIDNAGCVALIEKHLPDWRRVLNELQKIGMTGYTESGPINMNNDNFGVLMKALQNKNFKAMRKWVVDNIDLESQVIFR